MGLSGAEKDRYVPHGARVGSDGAILHFDCHSRRLPALASRECPPAQRVPCCSCKLWCTSDARVDVRARYGCGGVARRRLRVSSPCHQQLSHRLNDATTCPPSPTGSPVCRRSCMEKLTGRESGWADPGGRNDERGADDAVGAYYLSHAPIFVNADPSLRGWASTVLTGVAVVVVTVRSRRQGFVCR